MRLISQGNGEGNWRLPGAGDHKPQQDNVGFDRRGYSDAMQPVDIGHQFIAKLEDSLNLFDAFVLAGRRFIVEFRAEPVARIFGRPKQLSPSGCQELGNAFALAGVLFAPHNLLAGSEAHAHLAVNTARMISRRGQVFLTSAELKQIKELVLEFLGCAAAAETDRNTGLQRLRIRVVICVRGKFVCEHEFHVRGYRSLRM